MSLAPLSEEDFAAVVTEANRLGRAAHVSDQGAPVYGCPPSQNGLSLASLMQTGWRYLVANRSKALVGSVRVYSRSNGPRRSHWFEVERAYPNQGLTLSLRKASDLGESGAELRFIELPWMQLRIVWLQGREALFIDQRNQQDYNVGGLEELMRSKTDALRFHDGFDPTPDTPAIPRR